MSPRFLTLDEVSEIHADQVARYGGDAGLRDQGLLESAVAMPSATFDGRFLHDDLFDMAAAYLFRLVQNHAFVDGNKRVGGVAAVVFLELNGLELNASEEQFEELVLAAAQGQRTKQQIEQFFRGNSIPRDES